MRLLETKGLAIGYSSNRILQSDLDFSIEAGRTAALMGQNGVGKTTFLKTVTGLIPSLAGEVFIQGRALSQLSRAEFAKQCALVLTAKPAVGNLTVRELVSLGRHPYSGWLGFLSEEDQEVVARAIDLTKTNYITDRQVAELSDGQLQKVMIARALAQDTPIVILDEPVAHLDLYNKIEVMLLLREIAGQGKAVLISTHDVQVVTQLADELWLFGFQEAAKRGIPEDLILDGSLESMLFLSQHPYDLVHHRLRWPSRGPVVEVSGETSTAYWTQQALERQGFQFGPSETKVICREHQWELDGTFYSSIADLLHELRTVTSSHSS